MSLTVCIPDLIEQGKLSGRNADRAKAVYARLLAENEGRMGRAAAETDATTRTIAILEGDAAHARLVAGLSAKAQSDWLGAMRAAVGGADRALDPYSARVLLERIDKRADAIRNQYLEGYGEALLKHRRNVLGEVRHTGDLMMVLRERFGEATGDLNAKELADAMGATMDALRIRRNAAGGNTAKLDAYVFPQQHDARLVRAVTYEEWAAHPSIANARVRDIESGEWAQGLRREAILREAYEAIRSDGANRASPGAAFAGSMANQRAEARVIHFANADDWMAYGQRFGGKDNVYDIFVGHVAAMSRELALMETMGPNPNAMIRFQKDWIGKSIGEHGSQRQVDKVAKYEGWLQDTFDQLTGAGQRPTDRGVALTFSALRAWQVATKLGGAVLKSVPDFGTLLMTARFNGLSVMRTLGEYAKLWTPADFARGTESARANARLNAKLRIVTDDWLALSSASYRYHGQEFTGETARRLGDAVIRGSGLARHTRNGQWALGRQWHANLTEWRGRALTELEPAVQRQFARYGISSGDWDSYRATPLETERGHDWMFPGAARDQRVAQKFVEMILSEQEMAFITPHIRTRTMMAKAGAPGDFWGEVIRSAVLFKSFPLDIIVRHGGFTMERSGTGANRTAYALALTPMMIAGGALSVQLANMAAMKDPEPMDSAEFAGKATAASGALGIAGDVLFNQSRNYEMGLLQWMAGPLASDAIGVGADIKANIARSRDDRDTRWMLDGVDFFSRQVPGNNLWYTKQAYERLLIDQLRLWADEDAAMEKFERRERDAEKQGTGFWWGPGGGLDDVRAPDLGNALPREEEAAAGW